MNDIAKILPSGRTLSAAMALLACALFAHPAMAGPGDAAAGKKVFKACAACHAIGPDAANRVGPQLNGLIGRHAGTAPDYDYSAAMKNSGITWDEQTFARYIQSPRAMVPGTKMTFAGLKKPGDIANVLAYIESFDAGGANAH